MLACTYLCACACLCAEGRRCASRSEPLLVRCDMCTRTSDASTRSRCSTRKRVARCTRWPVPVVLEFELAFVFVFELDFSWLSQSEAIGLVVWLVFVPRCVLANDRPCFLVFTCCRVVVLSCLRVIKPNVYLRYWKGVCRPPAVQFGQLPHRNSCRRKTRKPMC